MSRNKIRGEQIKDESVDSADLASGSIRAGEVDEQIITGHPVASAGTVDVTNDRLLIWDANGSSTGTLKQVAPSSLGITASPGGSNTQVQYNNSGATAGGTKLLYDEANGRLKIGDTNAPQNVLDVYADISNNFAAVIDNDAGSNGHGLKVTSDGSGSGTNILDLESGSTTFFRVRGDGRVGIGKISSLPDAVLTVSSSNTDSDIAIAHKIHHIGDSNTSISFNTDEISFVAGGSTKLEMDSEGNIKIDGTEPTIHFTESGADRAEIGINDSDNLLIVNQSTNKFIVFKTNDAGVAREGVRIGGTQPEVVVNEGSDSLVDFRVESDNKTHMLYVDGSLDRVGVMTNSPKSTFHVGGSMSVKVEIFNSGNDPGTTYSCTATDHVILVNTRPTAQGGIDSTLSITLPDAGTSKGRLITIKDAGGYADVNGITVSRQGSDTIEGINTSVAISQPAQCMTFVSDGDSAWWVIAEK